MSSVIPSVNYSTGNIYSVIDYNNLHIAVVMVWQESMTVFLETRLVILMHTHTQTRTHTRTDIHHTSYFIHHTSYFIRHTSHIIHHTSYIIHHTSHIIHHTSYIIHHTSYITHQTHTKQRIQTNIQSNKKQNPINTTHTHTSDIRTNTHKFTTTENIPSHPIPYLDRLMNE